MDQRLLAVETERLTERRYSLASREALLEADRQGRGSAEAEEGSEDGELHLAGCRWD